MANVLLIEPNRVLGKTYHAALRADGHKIQTCATAQAALLAADRIKPDVVVLELQLVAHSGIEFLYEFQTYADWQSIPIIVHTHVPLSEFGTGTPESHRQFGIAEYFYKPATSLKTLASAIRHHTTVAV